MAGHYSLDDISIDIKTLCRRAGVRFIQQSIVQVDAVSNMVATTGDERLALDYDVLSLNTGTETDMRWLDKRDSYAKTDTHASTDVIAIRPLSEFITHWQQILAEARQASQYQLAIAGAGVANLILVCSSIMSIGVTKACARALWAIDSGSSAAIKATAF